MKKKSLMKKRAVSLVLVVAVAFMSCMFRILTIQSSADAIVADMQFYRSINLSSSRGYIYDRNMKAIVNSDKNNKAVSISGINEDNEKGVIISSEEYIDVISGDYVKNYYEILRYQQNNTLVHVTGYINSDGKGVSGIEKAFDRLLTEASGELKVRYGADASGRPLKGKGLELIDNNYDSPAGISLTIDGEIQKIAEEAIRNSEIECGAVVIMDVNTFEVIAMVSVPEYDPYNVEASLNDNSLPFLNRALNAYPAGSVFKPFVAAAALENGVSAYDVYECCGYIDIGSNTFGCFNRNVHGSEDLNCAIENSCNTYFIDMGIKTGAENIIETAKSFGFGTKTEFCSTIISSSGYLPEAQEISSDSQLANLCFGQGELLITPVQLAAAYAVFANGGNYKEPVLLKELIDDKGEVYGYYKSETEYNAISHKTCETVNTALYNNMLNGTGVNGNSSLTASAGKTATAQTGRYDENGKEILCTWFAGFFPYEEPLYSVVIFNENGSTASSDCAPVFKAVMEGIIKYQGVQ